MSAANLTFDLYPDCQCKGMAAHQERDFSLEWASICSPTLPLFCLLSSFIHSFFLSSFRNGVVEAKYLPLKIAFDRKTKRIHPEPKKNAKWVTVCGDQDERCKEFH